MMVDFSQIELTDSELELLERIEAKRAILKSDVPDSVFRRFELLKILESSKTTFVEPDGSRHPEMVVEFGENGRNFLYFCRNKQKEKRKESKRYAINTLISVLAIILSLISIIWQAYTWRLEKTTTSSGDTTARIEREQQPAPQQMQQIEQEE